MSWNDQIIEEFRETGGHPGGVFEGTPILLLHNTGAKSGEPRTNPLVYADHDGGYVVAASKGGADTHPDWYFNVRANPDVELEVGSERFPAKAVIYSEDTPEREEMYSKLEDTFGSFTEYKTKTQRVIPIIHLKRSA